MVKWILLRLYSFWTIYIKVGEENGVRFGIALRHILPGSMNHQQHDILITSQGVEEGVGGVMGIQTNVATDWCLA